MQPLDPIPTQPADGLCLNSYRLPPEPPEGEVLGPLGATLVFGEWPGREERASVVFEPPEGAEGSEQPASHPDDASPLKEGEENGMRAERRRRRRELRRELQQSVAELEQRARQLADSAGAGRYDSESYVPPTPYEEAELLDLVTADIRERRMRYLQEISEITDLLRLLSEESREGQEAIAENRDSPSYQVELQRMQESIEGEVRAVEERQTQVLGALRDLVAEEESLPTRVAAHVQKVRDEQDAAAGVSGGGLGGAADLAWLSESSTDSSSEAGVEHLSPEDLRIELHLRTADCAPVDFIAFGFCGLLSLVPADDAVAGTLGRFGAASQEVRCLRQPDSRWRHCTALTGGALLRSPHRTANESAERASFPHRPAFGFRLRRGRISSRRFGS